MGLDIRAYSKLSYAGHHEPWDEEREDKHYNKHIEVFSYPEFARHALAGVPDVRPMSVGETDLMSGGCYVITPDTVMHDFCAGSYSGYGQFRRMIADSFNVYRDWIDGSPSPEGPFYELLWFADNAGTLCEVAALNLLTDFRQHEAEMCSWADGRGASLIRDWIRACELAADGGLIEFC